MEISDQDVNELRQLEEDLWRAEVRYDVVKMEEIFAPDFFEFGRSGRAYQRADMLKSTSGEIPAELPLLDFKARLLDSNVAQVTYTSIVHYKSGTERGRRSSIWSRTPTGWQLRFHQGTVLPFDL